MWPRKLVHHLKGNDQQKANHVASSLVTSSSTPQYIDSQLVDLKVKCARVTWRGVMLLMILRMSMFCYSVLQYNTRLKIITIIVFTVTRWICKSYNLHTSENEFHFMNENQKYSLHKKWSFPLRISSVNFEICRKLWIWSHLLRKSLMEDFIFWAMIIFHIAVL